MRQLLFGLIKGQKIQQFIGIAWKRGISILNDPFLSAIIGCQQASYYQELKQKGRIFIENSANLLGVVDSRGILESNEVFIKIKRDDFKKRKEQNDDYVDQIINEILGHVPKTQCDSSDENEEEKLDD